MKVNDILKQVNRDIDDVYNLGDIVDWVNRCLDDLTSVSKRQSSVVLNAPYTLPTNLHELLFVSQNNRFIKTLPMNDPYGEGYKRWGDSLTVQNLDTSPLTIYYHRKLNKVSGGDDIPDLEEEFHDLFILFCLGNAQFYDEDYELRPNKLGEYEARKQKYIQYIEKRDRKKVVSEKVSW